MMASTQYLRVRIANAKNKRSAFCLLTLAWAERLHQPLRCPLTLPYLTLPYLALPCLTLPYLALPYLTSNQYGFTLPAACQPNLFLQFRNLG